MRVAQATDVADGLPHDPPIEFDRRLMAHGALFSVRWHRAHVSGRPSAGGVFDNSDDTKRASTKVETNIVTQFSTIVLGAVARP